MTRSRSHLSSAISGWMAVLAFLFMGCARPAPPDHSGLIEEIRASNKLVLASMAINKTARMDDSRFFGKRIAVYSYNTYLRAYMDLGDFSKEDVNFDEANKTVTVRLPQIRTEVAGRDMEMKKEYDNIGFLRRRPDSKERADVKEKSNASFNNEVVSNPHFLKQLEESARRKALAYFSAVFEAQGYSPEIVFKN